MEFKETSEGVFTVTDNNIRYVIVNCHLAPKHRYATGINFFLSIGKVDLLPIGNFWSLEDAKTAAINVRSLINELI